MLDQFDARIDPTFAAVNRKRLISRLAAVLPKDGLVVSRRRHGRLRERWPRRLSRHAWSGCAATNHERGGGDAQGLWRAGRSGCGSRGGHGAFGRRPALPRLRAAQPLALRQDHRHRRGRATGASPARGAEPRDLRSGVGDGPVLCARPFFSARVQHRRQRGGERRRRALPEVRADRPQRRLGRVRHHGGRDSAAGQRGLRLHPASISWP